MVAGINMYKYLMGEEMIDFTAKTALGALANYISTPHIDFQPMNVTHGIFYPLEDKFRKSDRKMAYANRSLEIIKEIKEKL